MTVRRQLKASNPTSTVGREDPSNAVTD